MSNPVPTPSPPPWEKLLHRLQFGDVPLTISEGQLILLRLLTDTREPIRSVINKLVVTLPRLTSIKAILVVQGTATSVILMASNLSKKRALELAGIPFLYRLGTSRHYTERRLDPATKKTVAEAYNHAACLPIGERPDGYQILLLSDEPISKSEEAFLRLVRNTLHLRHQLSLVSQELRQGTESLTTLTHHLSEGMAVLNQDLIVTLWNRPMQRLTGVSPREAIGKHYSEVFQRRDGQDWLKELLGIYAPAPLRNVFTAEFEIVTPDTGSRWVEVSGSFLRRKIREISQTILIVRDVTEAKMLEERKNEFISIATHELRTPITAIKGYLSLLMKDQGNLTEKQRTYMDRASDANERLVRLAEDLLRSVQVEEDRLRINLRPVNLYQILDKATRNLTSKAEGKKLTLELQKKPEYETWITADEEKVEQVFENLIDNAIKYTTEGGVNVLFDRFEENGEAYIIVHIQDTGIGISPKDYDTIFEKFRRTHNTVEVRESGAGLGLFIVKSFVEKQGGKISVNSKIGTGTTFSVRFPATDSPKKLTSRKEEKGENDE